MTVPDWALLGPLVADAVDRDARMTDDPAMCGLVDQARAELRDRLDRYGADMGDPAVVHAVLVGAELCGMAAERASVTVDPLVARVALPEIALRTVATMLADHYPAEARP